VLGNDGAGAGEPHRAAGSPGRRSLHPRGRAAGRQHRSLNLPSSRAEARCPLNRLPALQTPGETGGATPCVFSSVMGIPPPPLALEGSSEDFSSCGAGGRKQRANSRGQGGGAWHALDLALAGAREAAGKAIRDNRRLSPADQFAYSRGHCRFNGGMPKVVSCPSPDEGQPCLSCSHAPAAAGCGRRPNMPAKQPAVRAAVVKRPCPPNSPNCRRRYRQRRGLSRLPGPLARTRKGATRTRSYLSSESHRLPGVPPLRPRCEPPWVLRRSSWELGPAPFMPWPSSLLARATGQWLLSRNFLL
jgi:hypothetical protein